jgi:cell division septum initiation protein DivIVA
MEGSVSNVQFTERKRGFDPDEVANYLHHIDEKIAGLRAMATEAVERAELAEERARRAEADAASGGDEATAAAGVLAMAQRTADATLAEAREQAQHISVSAQVEAEALMADARRDVETTRAEHLAALHAEIESLSVERDRVAADIAALNAHLATERDRLRGAAAGLMELADTGFVATDAPVVGGAPLGGGTPDTAVVQPDDRAGGAAGQPPAADEVVIVTADDVARPESVVGDLMEDPDGTRAVSGLFTGGDEPADGPGMDDPGVGLFDEPVPAGSPGEQPGAVQPETAEGDDDAMRAFFEADVDDEPEGRGRWGRRR